MLKKVFLAVSLMALVTITSCQTTCTEPKDPGTGSSPSLRYYNAPGGCYAFQYNGQGGNTNNHPSENACKCTCRNDAAACSALGPDKEACKKPLERGNCGLRLTRYYYDINTRKCEFTVFGCLITNGNHYDTYELCKTTCEDNAFPAGAKCTDPRDEGTSCDGNIAPRSRWYYNKTKNECQQLTYYGCGGNQNRYISFLDCENTCVQRTFTPPDDCNVALDTAGECSNKSWTGRYYYDTTAKECRPFFFGQCKAPNKNNFMTLKDCQDKCHPPGTCQGLPSNCTIRNCVYGYKRNANDCPLCECKSDPCVGLQCGTGERCRLNPVLACKYPPCSVSGVCVKYEEICNGSLNTQQCTVQTAYTPRYFFNNVTKVCMLQYFHGCAGPNNFLTLGNCEHVCKGTALPSNTLCPDPVCNCVNNIGWNRDSNNCPVSCRCPSTPGGTTPTTGTCQANSCAAGFTCVQRCNTYPTCSSYVAHCVDQRSCAAVPTSALGNCNRAPLTMWYWASGGCRAFQWTGCAPTNLNLFVTQAECTRACGTTTSGTLCPTYSCAHCPGGTGTPVMSGNCPICQCSSTPNPSAGCTSCNTGCNTGYESYATGNTLANGCPECKCRPSSTTGGTPTPSSNVCGPSCLQTVVCSNGGRPQLYGKDQMTQCDLCVCTQGTPVPAPTPSVTTCANMPCFCGQGQTPVRDLDPATGQCRCQCQSTTSSSTCDCSTRVTCSTGEKAVLLAGSTTAACNCECCKTSCSCVGGGGTMTIDNRGCAICNCLTNPAPAPTPCTQDPSTCSDSCGYGTTWNIPSGATCARCECKESPCELNPPSCPTGTKCKPKNENFCRRRSCPATAICAVPSTVCRQPADRGTCDNSITLTRYRYDPTTGTCVGFAFSGCGGNDNNFALASACLSFCAGIQ